MPETKPFEPQILVEAIKIGPREITVPLRLDNSARMHELRLSAEDLAHLHRRNA